MRIRLKCLKKPKNCPKYQLDKLRRDQSIKTKFSISVQNKFEILREVTSTEGKLILLKKSIEKSLQEHVPVKPRKEHRKWMTQEILDLMNERRTSKGNDIQYKELNKEIRNKCNEAKEIWLNNKCAQIEANSRYCTKDMHDEIRELTGKRKSCPQNGCIRTNDGSMLTDRNEILDRWAV